MLSCNKIAASSFVSPSTCVRIPHNPRVAPLPWSGAHIPGFKGFLCPGVVHLVFTLVKSL